MKFFYKTQNPATRFKIAYCQLHQQCIYYSLKYMKWLTWVPEDQRSKNIYNCLHRPQVQTFTWAQVISLEISMWWSLLIEQNSVPVKSQLYSQSIQSITDVGEEERRLPYTIRSRWWDPVKENKTTLFRISIEDVSINSFD